MNSRCHNPKNRFFPDYGGRGISVCARWRESFENFLADMGERPPRMTLKRENNDGDYAPNNCRWASMQEQNRNKRNSRLVTANGQTMTAAEWGETSGPSRRVIMGRIRLGWRDHEIINTPVRPRKPSGSIMPPGAAAACRKAAINMHTVQDRIRRGWNYREALHTPVNATRRGPRRRIRHEV